MTSKADGGGGNSLIGVISWVDGCAVDGTLGVYARVGYYLQWIASQFGYAGIQYFTIYINLRLFTFYLYRALK